MNELRLVAAETPLFEQLLLEQLLFEQLLIGRLPFVTEPARLGTPAATNS